MLFLNHMVAPQRGSWNFCCSVTAKLQYLMVKWSKADRQNLPRAAVESKYNSRDFEAYPRSVTLLLSFTTFSHYYTALEEGQCISGPTDGRVNSLLHGSDCLKMRWWLHFPLTVPLIEMTITQNAWSHYSVSPCSHVLSELNIFSSENQLSEDGLHYGFILSFHKPFAICSN